MSKTSTFTAHDLDVMADSDDLAQALMAAMHPLTQSRTLNRLAGHDNPKIRAAVFGNPNCTVATLSIGAADLNQDVLRVVASHALLNAEMAGSMWLFASPAVFEVLEKNSALPEELRLQAGMQARGASKGNSQIGARGRAAIAHWMDNEITPEVLAQVRAHGNEMERAAIHLLAVEQGLLTIEEITPLFGRKSPWPWLGDLTKLLSPMTALDFFEALEIPLNMDGLRSDWVADRRVAERILLTRDSVAAFHVVATVKLDAGLLDLLADVPDATVSGHRLNADLCPFPEAIFDSGNSVVFVPLAVCALHPATTAETMAKVHKSRKVAVRVALVSKMSLQQVHRAAQHKMWQIRAAVARDPRISGDLLSQLAFDNEPYVRESVLLNPGATQELIGQVLIQR